MKNLKIFFATILFVVFLIGCAPVRFYSDSGLNQKAGLKYYTVKPYLMVERDPVSSNLVKATVIYLPDLEKPQFMVIKDGLGSRKVDLKLADGSISTFGIESDTKIAESINALSGLISKTTSAITDLAAPKISPPSVATVPVVELYEIIMNNGLTSVKKVEIK